MCTCIAKEIIQIVPCPPNGGVVVITCAPVHSNMYRIYKLVCKHNGSLLQNLANLPMILPVCQSDVLILFKSFLTFKMCFLCTTPIWDEAYVKHRDDTPPCTTSRYLRSVLNLKITNSLHIRIISLCGDWLAVS
jgi:hypothetical protein